MYYINQFEDSITFSFFWAKIFLGFHRSVTKEDIRKLKCLHAAECDERLKALSVKVTTRSFIWTYVDVRGLFVTIGMQCTR